MSEADYAELITAAHQELHAPVIPVLAVLCGQRRVVSLVAAGGRLGGAAAGHIMPGLREAASSTPGNREEVVPMLEIYFAKPQMADRIRACWIGAEIERYAGCWVSRKVFLAGHEGFLRPRMARSRAVSYLILRMVAAIFV